MSGPPVFLGQPLGAGDATITTGQSHHADVETNTPTFDRPSTHGSDHSESVVPESLASSQTMNASTPIGEKSRLEHNADPSQPRVTSEKTAKFTNPDGEGSLNEKKGNQEMVELDDGLVFLGTEAQSGKAIIKPKDQLRGGPYSQPKW